MSDNAKQIEAPLFENEITPFRQPMVTSIGIIMGFLLSFLANWAVNSDGAPVLHDPADWIVALTLVLSIMLFGNVLFRLLDNRIRPQPGERYQATLRLYMIALVLAFLGLCIALLL